MDENATRAERGNGEGEIWKRLEELLDQADAGQRLAHRDGVGASLRRMLLAPLARGRGVGGLDAEEIAELGRLYRAAANRLAQLRTFGAAARRLERLNRLVARGHAVVYGRSPRDSGRRIVMRSFLVFPVVVRRGWAFHAVAAALLAVGIAYGYFGAAEDPEWALEFLFPGDERTPFAEREELRDSLLAGRREGDVVDLGEKSWFAAYLWAHNTKVALVCFFLGLLLGVPTVLMLFVNGAMLGVYSATFSRHRLDYEWWAWVLPHGVTELLAIVLLAGGGLQLGYAVLVPGRRSRAEALGGLRGSCVYLVLFAFPMLFAAALIESFLRQSSLSDPGRYVFAAASALFWGAYLGFVRPPRRLRDEDTERTTVAEARVPLPDDAELRLVR